MGMGRKGVRKWRLPGLLYTDDLVLCGESFGELCRRRGLKVSGGKSKVMVLNGKEGLEC